MNVTFWAAYFCLYKNQTRVNTDIIKKISTAWLSKKKNVFVNIMYCVMCTLYVNITEEKKQMMKLPISLQTCV